MIPEEYCDMAEESDSSLSEPHHHRTLIQTMLDSHAGSGHNDSGKFYATYIIIYLYA